MLDQLTITEEKRGGGTYYMTAQGRIGSNEAPMLERRLERALMPTSVFTPVFVVLNMRKVSFLSSIRVFECCCPCIRRR